MDKVVEKERREARTKRIRELKKELTELLLEEQRELKADTDAVLNSARALYCNGRANEAYKLYREYTGCSLSEARHLIGSA